MGGALVRALLDTEGTSLAAALTRSKSAGLGLDAALCAGRGAIGVPMRSAVGPFVAASDAVIDVSTGGTRKIARACYLAGRPLVIGASNLDAGAEAELVNSAARIPVVRVANGSLGVQVLMLLVRQAVKALGPDADIEICETHHRRKIDAPSGTAVALGQVVAAARETTLHALAAANRCGLRGRVPGSVGFASLRGGDEPVEHRVLFL